MATNKIDYDVLEQAASTYNNQATAINDVLSKLNTTNGTLSAGWQNEASRTFIERYEKEHKKALEAARDSIASIADFITKYRANEMENDIRISNQISR